MSSKPSTPISQRKYPGESEYTRIPVPTSPIQFRRTYSMRRLRRPSSLCETTLKHNQNHRHQNHPSFNSTTFDNINPQQQFSSSSSRRRSSSQFSNMDCKHLANDSTKAEGPNGDPGGDQVDFSPCQYTKGAPNHLNGNFRRNSFSKHDRNGMVSCKKTIVERIINYTENWIWMSSKNINKINKEKFCGSFGCIRRNCFPYVISYANKLNQ